MKSAGGEFHNFAGLAKEDTGLGVDIFLDQCDSYKEFGHPLWLYFRNSYGGLCDYVPITIEAHEVLLGEKRLNIYRKDLMGIMQFIVTYFGDLHSIAAGEMDVSDLYKKIKMQPESTVGQQSIPVELPIYMTGKEPEFLPAGDCVFGCTLVRNEEGKFNYVDEGNHVVYDGSWFDVANDFLKAQNGVIRAYTILNGAEGFLYLNPTRWIPVDQE